MKVLLTLLIIFSTVSVYGDLNVRPSWSGSWYNPEQPGHGISVEILDEERTLIYWHTYDRGGKPVWLIAEGVNSSVFHSPVYSSDLPFPGIRVEATAYYLEGMVFGKFDPATKNLQEWGTIVLDFAYWECNHARMEWYPVMAGFSQGSTDLMRLTTLYGLDCVHMQDTAGNWEVQFGFDAENKHQVEIVATPNPEIPELTDLSFEFFDETDCLWSGQVYRGFGMYSADWGNQCEATAVEHSASGGLYFEYRLCNSQNECVWKDEVLVFEDEGEYLIFSR